MAIIIVLLGPTGAGKSVIGRQLSEQYSIPHISTGQILRDNNTEQTQRNSGHLIPDLEIESIVRPYIVEGLNDNGIILDGFPRTLHQAQWLSTLTTEYSGIVFKSLWIEISYAESLKRLAIRDRSDDDMTAIESKWNEYKLNINPLINFYSHQNQLYNVDGSSSLDTVIKRINKLFSNASLS